METSAKWVIGIVIFIYLLAALLPDALTSLNGANTTGWTSSQIAIYGVLGIVILAIVILKVTE